MQANGAMIVNTGMANAAGLMARYMMGNGPGDVGGSPG